MDTEAVKLAFDLSARTYDQARRQLIPCFDDFYGTVLALIPYQSQDHLRMLDLGAGTGLLSLFVSEQFPNAQIRLIDISEAMLAKARERFSCATERSEFIRADYSKQLSGEFDVVVSALSIHHLTDDLKASYFIASMTCYSKAAYLSTQTKCWVLLLTLKGFTERPGFGRFAALVFPVSI